MQQPLMFKLDQDPKGRGLRCDGDGLFLGREALLQRDKTGNFEMRPAVDLRKTFVSAYGEEADWESRIRSVKLIANALNKQDMARATMTAVLMRLPEPGGELGIFNVDGMLAKAGFNPDEARDERGQWTRDGDANVEASNTDRNPGVQLADAGLSDVVGDPVAEASARAAASSHRVAATDNSRNRSAGGAPKGFWEAVGSGLSSNVESVLSEIGQAQETQINSERTATAAEGNAALESLDAVNQFLERPAGGSTPITPEFPMWGGYGMDMTLAPTRPITVGDEVGAAANLFSLLPIGEGGSAALELSELATAERETFLAPYPEWQAHFKARWPAGRIVFPPDLPQGSASIGNYAHREIGRLFQEAHSDVRMILRADPPNQPGVDIEIHVSDVPKVGFRYGEIKPATASGVKEYSRNVRRWQKPEPVLPITYDRAGNVYYGFPVITEPDGD